MRVIRATSQVAGESPWWAGIRIRCPRCGCTFVLDAEDVTERGEVAEFRCAVPPEGCGSVLRASRPPDIILARAREGRGEIYARTAPDAG